MKQNTLVFNNELLKTYTRKQAYEAREQYIRPVKLFEVKKKVSIEVLDQRPDIFKLKSIPSKQQLVKWSNELAGIRRIAAGDYFIDCDLGSLLYEDVSNLSSMHNVLTLKAAVSQEVHWFNEPKLIPRNIEITPLENDIAKFKQFLWDEPVFEELKDLNMSPNTIAELIGKRLLTSDHMMFMAELINNSQSDAHVIYVNYITDIEKYAKKIKGVSRIIFLANVGNNEKGTYLGSNQMEGNHWSVAYCDIVERKIVYCDSLGWKVPHDIIVKMSKLFHCVFGYELDTKKTPFHCHNPAAHQYGNKKCDQTCSRNFPLQACGNVCGVVAVVIAAVIALKPAYFEHCIKSTDPSQSFNFIREPSKYSNYLRLALASWYGSKKITIDNIVVPKDDADMKLNKSDIIDDEEGVDEEDVDDGVLPCYCSDDEKMNKEFKKVLSRFQCPGCSETFTKKGNMTRHIQNKHSGNQVLERMVATGNCMCLQCGWRCHRIGDLRKHLIKNHHFIFETETIEFQNKKGLYYLST